MKETVLVRVALTGSAVGVAPMPGLPRRRDC